MMRAWLWLAALLLAAESKQEFGAEFQSSCADGETCCPVDSGGRNFSCCPYNGGVCCQDLIHCCPGGFTCDVAVSRCFPVAKMAVLTKLFNSKQPSLLNNNNDVGDSNIVQIENNGNLSNLLNKNNKNNINNDATENKIGEIIKNTNISIEEINDNSNTIIETINNNISNDNTEEIYNYRNNNTKKININSNNICLVNNSTKKDTNSTDEVDNDEEMSSFTVPNQGNVPLMVGGTVAGGVALVLGAYLGCKRRSARGYQNI